MGWGRVVSRATHQPPGFRARYCSRSAWGRSTTLRSKKPETMASKLLRRKGRRSASAAAQSCGACGRIVLESSGVLEGAIEVAPRGDEGFGYDPVFRPQGFKRTLSEMSPDEKNAISHRAQAVKALVAVLQQEGARPSGF